MSDLIQKAKDFITGHPDQADQGLDKAEELINERTGGTYADKLDQGTDKVREGWACRPRPTAAAPGRRPRPSTRAVAGRTADRRPRSRPRRARREQTCPACPIRSRPGRAGVDIAHGHPPQRAGARPRADSGRDPRVAATAVAPP